MSVCKNRFEKFARIFSRRHKQTTFSDAGFLCVLRVKTFLVEWQSMYILIKLILQEQFDLGLHYAHAILFVTKVSVQTFRTHTMTTESISSRACQIHCLVARDKFDVCLQVKCFYLAQKNICYTRKSDEFQQFPADILHRASRLNFDLAAQKQTERQWLDLYTTISL